MYLIPLLCVDLLLEFICVLAVTTGNLLSFFLIVEKITIFKVNKILSRNFFQPKEIAKYRKTKEISLANPGYFMIYRHYLTLDR